MPISNIILNGSFQSGNTNWSGSDLEIAGEHNYFVGGDSSNRVAELDGGSGTTVLEQQFTIDAPTTTDLEFKFELRQNMSAIENSDGFVVEVVSASDGSVIYTSGDVFPTDNDAATTTTQSFSAPVTFLASGDYILRFTEITLDGGHDGRGVIIDDVSMMVCFLKGTTVETDNGPTAIEDLKAGHLVVTKHHGLQEIRWIGSTLVATKEKLFPVRISAGALGSHLPQRDLLVSRQHRIVVSSQIADRMFGTRDVFVSAIKLSELPGVYEDKSFRHAEYFHILFNQHEVIFAEGTPVESLYTGPEALQAIPALAREEILTLFPEISNLDYSPKPVLLIPNNPKQKQLIIRHMKNNISVL